MRPFSWFIFGVLIVLGVWVSLQPEIWGPFLYPLRFREEVVKSATEQNLEPNFLASVIYAESGFREGRTSGKGARGLMQVREPTGRFVAQRLGMDYDDATLDDPTQNIRIGAWYLGYLVEKYKGNLRFALAAYNAGEAVVDGWVRDGREVIPFPETRAFVEKVKRTKEEYDRIYGRWYEEY